MQIRKRPSGFWHIEAFGWRFSAKVTRARWGWRSTIPGVFVWGLPFATGNIVAPHRSH